MQRLEPVAAPTQTAPRPERLPSAGAKEAALALVILAFAARIVGLGQDSLWFDTAHSAVVASNPTVAEVLRAAASDFQSPLYFLLLHPWLAISQDDFWLALPTAFLGTLTVALTYATARRWFSPNAALLAALVSALTSYQVYYSRYPRSYMLLTFLALLAVYTLHHALTEGKARHWVTHGIAVLLALYTHPYALFLLPILWAYAVVVLLGVIGGAGFHPAVTGWKPVLLRSLSATRPLAITVCLVGAGYLPWLGVSWSQWGGVREGADAWIEPVSRDSAKVLWDWFWFKTRLEYTPLIDLGLRLTRYALTALMVVALWRGRRCPELWLTTCLVAGPLALVYAVSTLAVPLWDARYLVMLSPFFALWLGFAADEVWGLSRLWAPPLHRRGRLCHTSALAAVIVLMSLPPLVSLYFDQAFRTTDIKTASRWVREQHQPGDLILHINYQSYLPALWYDQHATPLDPAGPFPVPCVWESLPDAWCRASPHRQGYVDLETTDFQQAVAGERRFWLMALYNHNRRGEEEEVRTRVRELTGARFRQTDEAHYLGVLVYRLELNAPFPPNGLKPALRTGSN